MTLGGLAGEALAESRVLGRVGVSRPVRGPVCLVGRCTADGVSAQTNPELLYIAGDCNSLWSCGETK